MVKTTLCALRIIALYVSSGEMLMAELAVKVAVWKEDATHPCPSPVQLGTTSQRRGNQHAVVVTRAG